MKDLKILGDEISFTVQGFSFSTISFYDNKDDSLLIKKEPADIPFSFTIPRTYSGKRNSDTIKLQMTSLYADSWADDVVFVKKL